MKHQWWIHFHKLFNKNHIGEPSIIHGGYIHKLFNDNHIGEQSIETDSL